MGSSAQFATELDAGTIELGHGAARAGGGGAGYDARFVKILVFEDLRAPSYAGGFFFARALIASFIPIYLIRSLSLSPRRPSISETKLLFVRVDSNYVVSRSIFCA